MDHDHSRREGTVVKQGKTERKWYEIDAQSGAVAEVWIYEEIGTDFWGEGLTAKKFVEDLAALDVEHIALHINSPGGSVFDGVVTYLIENTEQKPNIIGKKSGLDLFIS